MGALPSNLGCLGVSPEISKLFLGETQALKSAIWLILEMVLPRIMVKQKQKTPQI